MQAFDCVAIQPLGVMHDAYRALLSENTPHAKAIAANQLLKYVPIYSARSFQKPFDDAALEFETARLEKVLVDAFFLGRDTLGGRAPLRAADSIHEVNATWLSGTIARTGCFSQPSGGAGTLHATASMPEHASVQQDAKPQTPSGSRTQTIQTTGLLPVLLAILFVLACYLVYHSRHFRIKRVERLPRHAVAFKSSASFDNRTSAIIVLDISLGGAKIECDGPPAIKEAITLHLPTGAMPATIVWATAFYAGVMFERQLTQAELDTVLNDDGVTTRSRLSNVF